MMTDIIKVAALVVVVVGSLIIALQFIRKSRANGFPTVESTSHYDQMKGAMPPTPTPDRLDETPPSGRSM